MTPDAAVTSGSLWLIGALVSLAIVMAQAIKILADRRWPSKNGCSALVACRWDHEADDRLQSIYRLTKAINESANGPQGSVALQARMARDLDNMAKRLESVAVIQNQTVNLLERLGDRIPAQAAK